MRKFYFSIDHYTSLYDVQTLGMLSCVFGAKSSRLLKPVTPVTPPPPTPSSSSKSQLEQTVIYNVSISR